MIKLQTPAFGPSTGTHHTCSADRHNSPPPSCCQT